MASIMRICAEKRPEQRLALPPSLLLSVKPNNISVLSRSFQAPPMPPPTPSTSTTPSSLASTT